jgi:hypothetical protein
MHISDYTYQKTVANQSNLHDDPYILTGEYF